MSSQRGLWHKILFHILCPDPLIQNLRLVQPLGIWYTPSNMVWESSLQGGNVYSQNFIDPCWNFDRCVTVNLPEALPTKCSLIRAPQSTMPSSRD